MNMKAVLRCAVLLMAVFLAGCGLSLSVDATHDASADFSRYRSFSFALPADDGIPNSGALRAAIRQQMETRGYAYAAADPDLELSYSLKFSSRLMYTPVALPNGVLMPMHQQFTVGTVQIEMTDRVRRAVVWNGSGETLRGERLTADIAAAVAKIFTRYQFRAGSAVAQPAR